MHYRDMDKNSQSATIHKSKNVEINQMFIYERVDE